MDDEVRHHCRFDLPRLRGRPGKYQQIQARKGHLRFGLQPVGRVGEQGNKKGSAVFVDSERTPSQDPDTICPISALCGHRSDASGISVGKSPSHHQTPPKSPSRKFVVALHPLRLIASNAVVLTMPTKCGTVPASEATVCDPFSDWRRFFDVDLQPRELKLTLMGVHPGHGALACYVPHSHGAS